MSGYLESLSKSDLQLIIDHCGNSTNQAVLDFSNAAQEVLDEKSAEHHPDNQRG